ncbi:hypothetical protein SeMB42_g07276 [Synchytrium endobioticum]|uniref:CCR4-Not complex 3'-5'-exoribonuclease subunit Ccr4 n=1 Tax=Synchytrium endobioticum TaxID=286115 RepID=A0A507CB65_9FUNG|nr:hypothetical protein SeMB42_g07276 [Synchytrium endobioticum]TPX41856.1 hypothetical protein SeLEV6574_g05894 [Synchytrium endobioticum]
MSHIIKNGEHFYFSDHTSSPPTSATSFLTHNHAIYGSAPGPALQHVAAAAQSRYATQFGGASTPTKGYLFSSLGPSVSATMGGMSPGSSAGGGGPMVVGNSGPPYASMNSSIGPGQPTGHHHQKQIEGAQTSRANSAPHQRARTAAATARIATTAPAPANPRGGATPEPATRSSPMIGSAGNGNLTNGASSNSNNNSDKSAVNGRVDERASQWTVLDMGGMAIKTISRTVFSYSFLTVLYLNHNSLLELPPEICRLVHLVTLDVSGNKLTVLPSELGLCSYLKELMLYDNELHTLPAELGFLYLLETLGIEGNPIGDPIASIIQKDGTVGVIQYLRDSCPVPPAPPEREWIYLEEDSPAGVGPADTFTLLCYNTLCEKYASSSSYGYTPSWALNWEYRKEILLQEILTYNADIVCLQEVEMAQYEEYFRDQLQQHGDYESVFWPKSRARTMSEYERRGVDGCATFYKASKFSLVEKHLIEFQQIAMQRPEFRKTEDILNRVMIKDNIAVITLLELKETGSRVLVTNAHLHWDPTYRDVKLVQTAMLMDELQRVVNIYAALPSRHPGHQQLASNPSRMPVVIAGDFNSLPNSGVYEFLSSAHVSQGHVDFGSYIYGPYTSEGLTHRMSLKSAYAHIGELDFTNFTPTFKGVIDYIWYTTSTLVITGLLSNIDRDYSRNVVGFPNWHHPSDHIPLVVAVGIKSGNGNASSNNNTSNAASMSAGAGSNASSSGGGNTNSILTSALGLGSGVGSISSVRPVRFPASK